MRSLFQPGSESPLELLELSLSGGLGTERKNRLNNTPIRDDDNKEGPIFSIKFLKVGVERIRGGGSGRGRGQIMHETGRILHYRFVHPDQGVIRIATNR